MIYVIATVQLNEGSRDNFLKIFHALVPQVRAEEGCLEYGPTIDIATNIGIQPPPRENVVVIVEKWASVEALEKHLMTPHMNEYRKTVKDLVQGMTIQILQPV